MERIIDAKKQNWFDWEEIWRYNELFYFFTWRDIKIKYKQTLLGFLWAILQPLLMMLIFTFFFGRALAIPTQGLPYPVFVFSGLLLWTMFASGMTNASNSMVNNALIIKKIYFPRIIIPVSSILVALFDFVIAFLLFSVILIYYQQPISLDALIYWPLAVLLTAVATLGPGCLLAALNVKYRDFRYVIPFLVQILFFLTPIIYPLSILKYPLLEYAVAATPMYAAIEFFRSPISITPPSWPLVTISIGSGILFLVLGLMYFKRTENYFADLA